MDSEFLQLDEEQPDPARQFFLREPSADDNLYPQDTEYFDDEEQLPVTAAATQPTQSRQSQVRHVSSLHPYLRACGQ
jgi:hypothetical protein